MSQEKRRSKVPRIYLNTTDKGNICLLKANKEFSSIAVMHASSLPNLLFNHSNAPKTASATVNEKAGSSPKPESKQQSLQVFCSPRMHRRSYVSRRFDDVNGKTFTSLKDLQRARLESNSTESNPSNESQISQSRMSTCASSEYNRMASSYDQLSLAENLSTTALCEEESLSGELGKLRRICSNPEQRALVEVPADVTQLTLPLAPLRDSKSCSNLQDEGGSGEPLDFEQRLRHEQGAMLLSPPPVLPAHLLQAFAEQAEKQLQSMNTKCDLGEGEDREGRIRMWLQNINTITGSAQESPN